MVVEKPVRTRPYEADLPKSLTRRQASRRERILAIARDLLAERDYDGVTMRLLADRSGVALKTLYDIYGSKDDLLVAAVTDRVNRVFHDSELTAGHRRGVQRLLYLVDCGTRGIQATQTLSRAIAPFLAGPVDRFGTHDLYRRYHGRALIDIQNAGELEAWVQPEQLLDTLIIALTGLLLVWTRNQISADELINAGRLTAAQVLLPAVTGKARRETLAVIRNCYQELERSGKRTSAEGSSGVA